MKYLKDKNGRKMTKFSMCYELAHLGGNYNKYMIYSIYPDLFSYEDVAEEYKKVFNL